MQTQSLDGATTQNLPQQAVDTAVIGTEPPAAAPAQSFPRDSMSMDMPAQDYARNSDVRDPRPAGGIARSEPADRKIVQYYGADMNDTEVSNLWSVPFMVLAALMVAGLAVYFVLQKRFGGGFIDHFGR